MVRLSQWIDGLATGRASLVALVLFLLFPGLGLPAQAARAPEAVIQVGVLGLRLFYTADELYLMAEAYGEEARRAYITARLTFDVIWPLVYAFFLGHGHQLGVPAGLRARKQLAARQPDACSGGQPGPAGNACTTWVMARHPSPAPLAATAAGGFTLAKWLFAGLSFAALLCGLAVAVRREGGGRA